MHHFISLDELNETHVNSYINLYFLFYSPIFVMCFVAMRLNENNACDLVFVSFQLDKTCMIEDLSYFILEFLFYYSNALHEGNWNKIALFNFIGSHSNWKN